KWIGQDVAWIISDDERMAFKELGTDEEREQFVEQFWLRRDPTPETVENEYKEEHYRRIAYANAHFASGIGGWRTDRGRIYIRFGAPDEIEAHPSGGSWQRPAEQGGGSTSTYPFEVWRYRHLDNVGENILVEFVDPTQSGEYRITIDPCEKDALTHVQGSSSTTQPGQTSPPCGVFLASGGGAGVGGRNQFDRLEQQAKLEKAPAVRFKDLEAVVDSRVMFNVLPVAVQVDYLRITSYSVLTNVTVQFENRELQFQAKDGVQKAQINLLGRVYTMSRRPVSTFEKALEIVAPAGMLEQAAKQKSVYQQAVPLAPGKYKLDIAARDTVSGAMARAEVVLDVPRFDDETLGASSLILAGSIQPLASKEAGGAMFAIGGRKVRPRVSGQFARDEKMAVYLEIYNSAAGGKIFYEVDNASTKQSVYRFSEDLKAGNQVTVERLFPLRELELGAYTMRVKAGHGEQGFERQARFEVVAQR
ncbi:MAG: hypothetical protein QOJ99_1985, partial [Bryobacterales bacterium]|nr:hypothetical protein [Bryobacterales bacterium]